MFKRKVKKLVKNPKLFFSDMKVKHSDKISYLKPKKMEGHYDYTVVSAVYNVSRYLDDFFESFVKQRLDFKKHIQLILVDDGSTDNSAGIIQRWQKKYPNNITYIYKENGGQASARNLGLQHVKTKWVTFIDSDDFVSSDYFSLVDELVHKNSRIKMVCCNQIYYFEDVKKYIDRHPLNYRFKNEKTILPCDNLGKFMQFSAPLSFFSTEHISNNLRFDERLKPTFEDGKFVAHYIMGLKNSDICFYAKPKYYNRKRMDKSSTMDNAWFHKGQYDVVLKHGYIETFKSFLANEGKIPRYFQRTILWEMLRLVKHIVNKEENLAFLNNDEKLVFLNLMDEVFTYIDSDTILSYELGSCGFSRQVGMLGCFKDEKPINQVVYIDKIDHNKKEILLRYFTCHDPVESFALNGNEIYPNHEKTAIRTFLSRTFLKERRIWLPVQNGRLDISIDNKPVAINFLGKKYKGSINLTEQTLKNKNNSNIWMLMDRDDMAGDNAEFLYRHILRQHPEINPFFVLNKTSPDWKRLEKSAFQLIEHGSTHHKNILKKCSKVISSHIGTITNPFDDIETSYLTIFLQHGVTKDNISNWINNCHLDMMITATQDEHNEIISNYGQYIYGSKEVKLTGFPRFDSLLSESEKSKKQILIMPTWRKSIAGSFVNKGSSKRTLNVNFQDTNYAKKISNLLSNRKLIELCQSNNVELIFCPHPNMKPYIKQLNISKSIQIASDSQSIHELIKQSSMLITDYSSVAFDVAYMNKPVIYYQFDEIEFFSGSHTYSKGYFDYRRDGFGPVINLEDELVSNIEKLISSDLINPEVYSKRVIKTFPSRDQQNCKRVFDAISSLDKPNTDTLINIDVLIESARNASKNKAWILSEERWGKIQLISEDNNIKLEAMLSRIEAFCCSGKLRMAEKLLDEVKSQGDTSPMSDAIYYQQAKLAMARHHWHAAIDSFKKLSSFNSNAYLEYLRCLAELQWDKEINKESSSNTMSSLSKSEKIIVEAWISICTGSWKKAIATIQKNINKFNSSDLKNLIPEIILARCFRELGNVTKANYYLEKYELHSRNNPLCREEIATLAYSRGNWEKAVNQIKQIYSEPEDLPDGMSFILINCLKMQIKDISLRQTNNVNNSSNIIKARILREQGRVAQADILMKELTSNLEKDLWDKDIYTESARLAMAKENWQEAISFWEKCLPYDNISGMARLRCLAELNRHKAIKRSLQDISWLSSLSDAERLLAESFYYISRKKWEDAINLLSLAIPKYDKVMLMVHKPELWLSHCLREQGLYIESHNQLENFEKHTKNDPQCRVQIAKLAMSRGDMIKAIHQIELAYPDSVNLPKSIALILVTALSETKNYDRANQIRTNLSNNVIINDRLAKQNSDIAIA